MTQMVADKNRIDVFGEKSKEEHSRYSLGRALNKLVRIA
jgi:hypothetical protein